MTKSDWANNLLQDENFSEVFKDLRQVQVDRIVNSNEHDIQEREAAYNRISAIQDVYNHIVSLADSRKINEKKWRIF